MQREMAYRLNFFLGRIGSIVIFLSLVWLWSAVFQSGTVQKGYDTTSIFTYILIATLVVDIVISQQNQAEIADIIADGRLNTYLVRPISFFWNQVMRSLTAPMLIVCTIPFQLIIFFLIFPHQHLALPQTLLPWVFFFFSLSLALILSLLIDFLVGCIAFWMYRAYGPRFMMTIIIFFASGAYIPITLLPDLVQKILMSTPFPFLIYAPVHILTQFSSFTTWTMIVGQLIWIFVLGIIVKLVWKQGLKRYEAAGI